VDPNHKFTVYVLFETVPQVAAWGGVACHLPGSLAKDGICVSNDSFMLLSSSVPAWVASQGFDHVRPQRSRRHPVPWARLRPRNQRRRFGRTSNRNLEALAQPRPKSAPRSRCRVVGTPEVLCTSAWNLSDECGAGKPGAWLAGGQGPLGEKRGGEDWTARVPCNPQLFWSWVSFQPGFDSARGILTLPTLVVQYLERMSGTRQPAHSACSRRWSRGAVLERALAPCASSPLGSTCGFWLIP
jgi:hypothetical protein